MTNNLLPEIIDCILKLQSYAKSKWSTKLVCYDCGEFITIAPFQVGPIQIGTGRCDCSRQHENNLEEWELKLQELVTEPKWILEKIQEEINDNQ